MRKSLAAVLLASLCAVQAHAADAKLKILSATGTIMIKQGGETITVMAGDPLPEIAAGAQVTIISGEATFQSGGAVVRAGAGDMFSYAATGPNPQITAEAGSITVTVGNTTATLDKGDGISVQGVGGQKAEIKVTSGDVAVQTGGKMEVLTAGKTMTTDTPPQSVPVTETQTSEAPPETTTSEPTVTQTAPNPTQETNTTPVSPSSP